jgi:hypothetical protein
MTIRPADWSLWGSLVTAEVWEAVALSFGAEPSSLPVDWRPINGGDYFAGCPSDYRDRLRITCDHAMHGNLRCLSMIPILPRYRVRLVAFSDWALSMGWDLPNEFPRAPAKTAGSGPPVSASILYQWYEKKRIAECVALGLLPSEEDDMAAALATFGEARVRRAQIRQVRTELAPPEWKRQGPRKKRSEDSETSSGNSAY